MQNPSCKRFFRRCDEFTLCVNIGQKGYVLAEHPNERYTIFYYGLSGSGIFGRVFDKESPIILDSSKKEVVDVQEYIHDKVIFESTDDFHIIGFNTLNKNIKWKATKLDVNQQFIELSEGTPYLVCLNGNPIVENNKLKRYDYSSLSLNKRYNISMTDNDVLVIFNQIGYWQ